MQVFDKLKLSSAAVALVATVSAMPAHADFAFSGSGASGFLNGASEPWRFSADGGIDWGSPGVGSGVTGYSRSVSAFGFDISFTDGGRILPGSVALGNASACAGSSGGGTTFCTIGPIDIWQAIQIDDHTIDFRAQNPTFFISPGQNYFVNVFFEGPTPTAFTGRWVTDFSPTVPEPSALALVAIAVLGLGLSRRKSA